MLNKIKNFVLVIAICFLAQSGFSQGIDKTKENKIHNIVVQLNTADTASWSSIIGNIKNIQKVWPTNLNIEVVVHGKAIDFLIKDKTFFAEDIQLLSGQGIKFNA